MFDDYEHIRIIDIAPRHDDREGRHYYESASRAASNVIIVVATLAVVMFA